MEQFEYDIDEACSGMRLDVFLTEVQADVSRSFVKKLIENGRVLVNGAAAKASYTVRPGDAVEMTVPEAEPLEVIPEDIPLKVVLEDSHLLVVDKPPGLVVHPAPGHSQGTLVNAVLFHCRDLAGIGGVIRPGIVHRLDKDTSGLIVIAKTETALNSLQQQFHDRTIFKEYRALACGCLKPERGRIESPIGRHRVQRKKMAAGPDGREAQTDYEVLQHFDGYDYIRLLPKTGRTHQIRVHLASIGHPILGDALYGGNRRSGVRLPERQALHAYRLEFDHPGTGNRTALEAPFPVDLTPWIETASAS